MKRGNRIPLLDIPELRQAVEAVRNFAGQPAEHEEGYDPHVEHREYERLKAELKSARAELERVRNQKEELAEALDKAEMRSVAAERESDSMSWKRAIVLSEILGTPRSRRK